MPMYKNNTLDSKNKKTLSEKTNTLAYVLTVLILLLSTLQTRLFAQDHVLLRDGSEIQGKILEIGDKEVTYKTLDNPNGPVHLILKTEVFMITYENGSKELFSNEPVRIKANSERCVTKGNNIINAYYGACIRNEPYYQRSYFDPSEVSKINIKKTYSSIGPVGVVFEHLITDKVGLGAELGYRQINMSVSGQSNDSIAGQVTTHPFFKQTCQITMIRAMLRANFHFANTKKFNAYTLVSAGFKHTQSSTAYHFLFFRNSTPLPFGVKLGMGFRYFFNKNIGLNIEIAAGTPVICGGLALKF